MCNQPVRVIERYCKKYIKGTALDAGCGTGRNLGFFPRDSIGIDNDLGALREARKTNSNVVLADLNYKLPFIDEAFDFILCLGVLEHLEAPYKTVKEFHRILVQDGILIVGIPNPFCIYNNYYDPTLWPWHNYSWTYGEAKRFILNLNFSIKKAYVHPRYSTIPYGVGYGTKSSFSNTSRRHGGLSAKKRKLNLNSAYH